MINEIDSSSNAAVNQADYMKLFMQELTYQDPLKPVDNREFMAQMAQFSALQATQQTNEYLQALAGISTASQSLMMLGKQVKLQGSEEEGQVREIKFPPNSPPKLVISMNGASIEKMLNDISQVRS